MRAAITGLAALCLLLGVVPGLLVPTLAELAPQPVELPAAGGLEIPGTGSLPSPWLALGLLALAGLLWGVRGRRRAAPTPAWACGQPVEPALQWTSSGFTKPLRLVLEVVLRPRREVVATRAGGLLQQVSYRGEVPHHFDSVLYGPIHRSALRGARLTRRLQSGSIRTYAAYLLALLLALLALLKIGVLG